ncbi:hypothetical protein GDO81_008999 [Engystomops pustulosus]|uniref:Uncharacterized protein n=1 Tax=Engystomops pustulosus TaxID=76066 RepID=A0AAV7BNI3_ENGPU|nr:hypothetical protein GDO81_008999 [Engystomops pustulosus]
MVSGIIPAGKLSVRSAEPLPLRFLHLSPALLHECTHKSGCSGSEASLGRQGASSILLLAGCDSSSAGFPWLTSRSGALPLCSEPRLLGD